MRGIGTELMRKIETFAIGLDIDNIRLFVDETKIDAIRLYTKRGFSIDEGNNVGTLIAMLKCIQEK